jgi:hypothetical protein
MPTAYESYVEEQITPMLERDEQILYKTFMAKQPGLLWQILLVGGLLLFLMTKAYFVVVTSRRLIIIRTKQGFIKPALVNLGVEEIPLSSVQKVTSSGIANNRSMSFHKTDGSKLTLRIAPWSKQFPDNKTMLEELPAKLDQGQLSA